MSGLLARALIACAGVLALSAGFARAQIGDTPGCDFNSFTSASFCES